MKALTRMSEKDESIEVGTIEVKVVPSIGVPEKATLLVVEPQKSCLPIMFERSARTFWNPQFDSSQLEKYHQKISMQQTLRIFQYALGYIALSCLAWLIYIGFQPRYMNSWTYFLVGLLILFLATLIIFLLSCTKIYSQHKLLMSVFVALILCTSSLLYYVFASGANMSLVGIFIGSVEIITLMYTFIPMPLYFSMIIGVIYSIVFETFSAIMTEMSDWHLVVGRLLLHAAVHFLGVHLFVVSQVRQRSTFLKVGQSIKSRRDLQVEKQFKQDMIHSLMPPKVAQEVMSSRDTKGNTNDEEGSKRIPGAGGAAMTFRSFHMSKMENVSILFADIVGFTKMSSNKSAEHLVSLLSDLFGRFDDICCKCGCEKISTLGDCYYCVSGCPEPRADHARCCVEMGLSMCIAIKQVGGLFSVYAICTTHPSIQFIVTYQFDEDHKEEVNMRVGVHTGTVLCGLVGTRRFKFDVWSHDVTIANMMESEGRPGCVHISNHTYKFVENDYDVEKGESVPDIRGHKTLIECFDSGTQQYIVQHVAKESTIDTWFILDRKPHVIPFVPDAQLQIPKSTLDLQKNEGGDQSGDHEDNDKKNPSSHLLPGPSNCKDLNDASVISAHLLPLDGSGPKQSDTEMIECMQSCNELRTYLYRPPINRFTLNYTDPVLEKKYRRHCLDDIAPSSDQEGQKAPRTRALPDITNLFDLALALVFFLLVAISCIVSLSIWIPFWVILSLALLIQLLFLVCATLESYPNKFCGSRFLQVLNRAFLGWFPRHIIHILVAAMPACLVYSAFSCNMCESFSTLAGFSTSVPVRTTLPFDLSPTSTVANVPLAAPFPYGLSELFFCMALVVSLLHFCNFTLLSSWFKFFVAGLTGAVLLVLVHLSICMLDSSEGISPLSESWGFAELNASHMSTGARFAPQSDGNKSAIWSLFSWIDRPPNLAFEIILVVLLLLLLIALINYDVEVGYRLCYHGDVQVAKDKQKILKEKEQADWLLHIIVPEHVADQLKHKRHYCENHKDVGVIFAKISNFDDFYDESYEGGKEYLRVLNELMGDFEELFDLPQYKDVEKIKTIGSCLMAASGLDPRTRKQNKDPDAHLYALMDFAVAIVHKVEAFNRDIFNFNFEMKIGFNAGEVTAGVIGTEKLLYDIWGDTVNIASRMYSTGVHDRIQITEALAKRLEPKFDFEYRGQTYVKGKGDMNTYLLVRKKGGATWS